LPGGRLEPGEQPEACLHREIFEELYLDVAVGPLLDCWTYRIVQVDREVVIVSYACRLKHDLGVLSFSDEHLDAGLFSLDTLPGLALPEGYRRAIAKAAGSAA
jgi:8-oxo-dGTP pyrophosphatase MutT (NUDIX family)